MFVKNMPGMLLAAICCAFLYACAPGYTGSDVKEGLKEDADQIGAQFDKDVKGTEKMFTQIGDDLDGKKPTQEQRISQMAKLCKTNDAEIRDLRNSGLTWTQIAKICKLEASPDSEVIWVQWEN